MSFWQFFTSALRSHRTPPPPLGGNITDKNQLCELFEKARDNDEIVNVRIFGHKGTYATAILEIDREKGYMILDGFADADGHHALLRHKRFLAGVNVDDVPLKFEASLAAVGVQDEIPFYKVPLPPKARYLQRRSVQRIDLLDQDTRFSGEHGGDGIQLNGFLKDISEQGATIVLDQPLTLLRREPLRNCVLDIPGVRPIKTEMLVRHARPDQKRGVTLLGANFFKADKTAQRRIRKAIAKLLSLRDGEAQEPPLTTPTTDAKPNSDSFEMVGASTPIEESDNSDNEHAHKAGWHFQQVVEKTRQANMGDDARDGDHPERQEADTSSDSDISDEAAAAALKIKAR